MSSLHLAEISTEFPARSFPCNKTRNSVACGPCIPCAFLPQFDVSSLKNQTQKTHALSPTLFLFLSFRFTLQYISLGWAKRGNLFPTAATRGRSKNRTAIRGDAPTATIGTYPLAHIHSSATSARFHLQASRCCWAAVFASGQRPSQTPPPTKVYLRSLCGPPLPIGWACQTRVVVHFVRFLFQR